MNTSNKHWLLLLGGIVMIVASIRMGCNVPIKAMLTCHSWVPVEATIKHSGVEQKTFMMNSFNRPVTYYALSVRYQYSFEDRAYTGNQAYLFKAWTRDAASIEPHLHRFAKGAVVTAYVNPQSPDNAILDKTLMGMGCTVVIMPTVFLILGLCLLFGYFRNQFIRNSGSNDNKSRMNQTDSINDGASALLFLLVGMVLFFAVLGNQSISEFCRRRGITFYSILLVEFFSLMMIGQRLVRIARRTRKTNAITRRKTHHVEPASDVGSSEPDSVNNEPN